jgi:hypothetical protein
MTKTIVLYVLAASLGLLFGGTVGKKVRLQRISETISMSTTALYPWCDSLIFKLGIPTAGLLLVAFGFYIDSLAPKVGGLFALAWGAAYWRRRTHSHARSDSGSM